MNPKIKRVILKLLGVKPPYVIRNSRKYQWVDVYQAYVIVNDSYHYWSLGVKSNDSCKDNQIQ